MPEHPAFRRFREATHVYIARERCGCVSGAAVDLGDRDTARSVADFIRSGRTVERVERKGAPLPLGCACQKRLPFESEGSAK